MGFLVFQMDEEPEDDVDEPEEPGDMDDW